MKQRGIFVLGAVVVAVAVGVACSGSDESELGSDAGSNPTSTPTSTSTSTSTTTTTAPTTPPVQDAAPSTDAAPGTDSGADAARPDAGTSMSFFVTSTGSGAAAGGNLGGLAGADTKCQTLATAAGVGGRTWRAYLSIAGTNARDRIGAGPWYNQKGVMIAANVAGLHTNNIPAANAIDEKGAAVPANEHDILTGSNADGSANAATCNGWTSNAGNQTAIVGHHDSSTTGNNADRWNNAHATNNCASFTAQGGSGRIYCFATN